MLRWVPLRKLAVAADQNVYLNQFSPSHTLASSEAWLWCSQWRIVHDHNTALDFVAFARMAGIQVNLMFLVVFRFVLRLIILCVAGVYGANF